MDLISAYDILNKTEVLRKALAETELRMVSKRILEYWDCLPQCYFSELMPETVEMLEKNGYTVTLLDFPTRYKVSWDGANKLN